MDVKLISTKYKDSLSKRYVAEVNGVKVEGIVTNVLTSKASNFRLKLIFANKAIIKDPRYKEIRYKLLKAIIKDYGNTYFARGVII